MILLVIVLLSAVNHYRFFVQNVQIELKKIRWQWLHRFDSTAKKHQVFEKNHHQRQWFINASIRG